jgi:hypothetical protein
MTLRTVVVAVVTPLSLRTLFIPTETDVMDAIIAALQCHTVLHRHTTYKIAALLRSRYL